MRSDRDPAVSLRSRAKINLALTVLGKRSDGYHEVRTVLQTIDLADELEFRPAPDLTLEVEGDPALARVRAAENLVWRAASALGAWAGIRPGAAMRLRKHIPAGAGLGGGSGNAAAALVGLSRLWRLHPRPDELRLLAAALGSDVPFFLEGGTALGIGRGEEIYPLEDFPETSMVVIYPGVTVSTRDAYASLGPLLTSQRTSDKITSFCSHIARGLGRTAQIFNDFEASILPAYPAVREAKDFLLRHGSTAAMLSGSGSSVFGFFVNEESALAVSRAAARENWRAFPAKTLTRAEYLRQLSE